MKYKKLFVEKKDHDLLMRNLSMLKNNHDGSLKKSLDKLNEELKTDKTFQLVAPEKSNLAQNKISILTPMGLALFGYAEGDVIDWEFPIGTGTITILKVEQLVVVN